MIGSLKPSWLQPQGREAKRPSSPKSNLACGQRFSRLGCVDGGSPCRMLIIRNGRPNVIERVDFKGPPQGGLSLKVL